MESDFVYLTIGMTIADCAGNTLRLIELFSACRVSECTERPCWLEAAARCARHQRSQPSAEKVYEVAYKGLHMHVCRVSDLHHGVKALPTDSTCKPSF